MTYVVMYVKLYTEKGVLTWTRLEHSTLYHVNPQLHGDRVITDNLYVSSDARYMVSMTQDPEEVEDLQALLWSPPVETDT